MLNVHFESYYLFFVSAGIIIMAFPFILIFLYTTGAFDTIISINDFAS